MGQFGWLGLPLEFLVTERSALIGSSIENNPWRELAVSGSGTLDPCFNWELSTVRQKTVHITPGIRTGIFSACWWNLHCISSPGPSRSRIFHVFLVPVQSFIFFLVLVRSVLVGGSLPMTAFTLKKMFAWNSNFTLLSNSESTPMSHMVRKWGFIGPLVYSNAFDNLFWSISGLINKFFICRKIPNSTDLNRIHTFEASEGILVRFLVLF